MEGFASATLDFKEAVEQTKRKIDTVVHEFGQDLAAAIIKDPAFPVKTGHLRGSFFFTVDEGFALNYVAPPGSNLDPSGAMSVARVTASMATAEIGQVWYLINAAHYAAAVEFGSKGRTGRYFVTRHVHNAKWILQQTVARIAL